MTGLPRVGNLEPAAAHPRGAGVGSVEQRVEVADVRLPLASFRITYTFRQAPTEREFVFLAQAA